MFVFRCDICLHVKSQAPEELYIGSEGDEELVCISNRELHQLQADVRHLHDENLELTKQNLGLTLTIRNGWDQRQQPLKASLEQLAKLNKDTLFKYFASHNMAPSKRSGLGRIKYEELLIILVTKNLVVNCQADGELVRENIVANSQDTRFLFIATPDCKLITMKFEAKFAHPDAIKLKYIQLLRALYDQEVPADWVRLFPNDLFKKDDKKIETLNTKIMNLDKLNVPCLHAMHLVPFQIFVRVLPRSPAHLAHGHAEHHLPGAEAEDPGQVGRVGDANSA